jgi:Domain of unknown function (DUF4326)
MDWPWAECRISSKGYRPGGLHGRVFLFLFFGIAVEEIGVEAVTRPVRLQLSRAQGFNLQKHSRAVNGLAAVNCARPGRWGNPFRIGMGRWMPGQDDLAIAEDATHVVRLFRQWITYFVENDAPGCAETRAALEELRGKNLACWCGDGPCHADVLLELANK